MSPKFFQSQALLRSTMIVPFFKEMIYKAKRADKPFQVVVVHSLSRFSRDALHSELYVRQLGKAGVQLVSITQDIAQDTGGEFIRKVLNVFDEHQSRENAKHVHRAMCENTRQGFWNGSHAPFGYRTVVKERRGNKDKKVLVVDEDEARVVRKVFAMAAGEEGRPVGVKAIASYFNERGILRRGRRFSTGSVHGLLTSTTYYGLHYFNRHDSRNGTPRPPSQWVALEVPAIIDEQTFNAVQGLDAEPRSEAAAASRGERPDLPGRPRALRLLRGRHDPEYRQGRHVPLLLLLAQAEGGHHRLSRACECRWSAWTISSSLRSPSACFTRHTWERCCKPTSAPVRQERTRIASVSPNCATATRMPRRASRGCLGSSSRELWRPRTQAYGSAFSN